ncbi:MAG: hypothetical protein NZ519_12605 [Bacteroidia bacterium]|nr:hypothetical protein [Bacteroidia bacterium]
MSLPTSRYARVGKVGVLRAALSLRCFANATHCLTHPPHASRKNLGRSADAIYSKFYPVSTPK